MKVKREFWMLKEQFLQPSNEKWNSKTESRERRSWGYVSIVSDKMNYTFCYQWYIILQVLFESHKCDLQMFSMIGHSSMNHQIWFICFVVVSNKICSINDCEWLNVFCI